MDQEIHEDQYRNDFDCNQVTPTLCFLGTPQCTYIFLVYVKLLQYSRRNEYPSVGFTPLTRMRVARMRGRIGFTHRIPSSKNQFIGIPKSKITGKSICTIHHLIMLLKLTFFIIF